jgi:hypothetical protein
MAAELLVDSRIDDGERVVDQLIRDNFEVTVAFWVKLGEYAPWHLYIASPMVKAEKPGQAYPALYASLSKIPNSSVQLSDIKLVNDANPIARDAIMLRLQYPGMMPTKFPGKSLGDLSIEEVYVYPLPSKRQVTIYGLVYKGEPRGALHLALEPQNPNSRLIVQSMGQRHEYPADTSMTWVVSVPEGSTLERDDIGRLTLVWDLRGRRIQSDANEVWSFARNALHSFRFVRATT